MVTADANGGTGTRVRVWLLLTPGAVVVLLLAVVPMLQVARQAFSESGPYGAATGGFTADNFRALLDPVYAKTIGYSLAMAAVNTVVCVVVGYAVSYHVVRQPAHRQPLWLLAVMIPFWTDFLVRTFAWITLLGRGGPLLSALDALGVQASSIVPSRTAVLLALLYAFLPTAVFPIYAAMRSIDPALRDAATDLGCGWWQVHARVLVPLSATGIVGAVLLTFVPTLGVFVIPVLLGGGKDPLVGNLVVTLYTEFRNQPMGAALSMVVFGLMLASLAAAGAAIAAQRHRRSRWTD